MKYDPKVSWNQEKIHTMQWDPRENWNADAFHRINPLDHVVSAREFVPSSLAWAAANYYAKQYGDKSRRRHYTNKGNRKASRRGRTRR